MAALSGIAGFRIDFIILRSITIRFKMRSLQQVAR